MPIFNSLPGQLPFPVVIVGEWITARGFIFSTVDTDIRLTVTVQIKLAQRSLRL
jgi:hypothetical protein